MNSNITTSEDTLGSSGKVIIVTKKDHEGGIMVDAFTGVVLQPTEGAGNPEWAQGLTQALLAERHVFYEGRLGPLYTDDLKFAETLAYEDLAWMHVTELNEPLVEQPELRNEDGTLAQMEISSPVELNEISADHEFRMAQFAKITGLDVEQLEAGTLENSVSVEIAMDQERTVEDLADFEQSKQEGFKSVAG